MKSNEKRVLAYQLCRELTAQELNKVSGGTGTVIDYGGNGTPRIVCTDDDQAQQYVCSD